MPVLHDTVRSASVSSFAWVGFTSVYSRKTSRTRREEDKFSKDRISSLLVRSICADITMVSGTFDSSNELLGYTSVSRMLCKAGGDGMIVFARLLGEACLFESIFAVLFGVFSKYLLVLSSFRRLI